MIYNDLSTPKSRTPNDSIFAWLRPGKQPSQARNPNNSSGCCPRQRVVQANFPGRFFSRQGVISQAANPNNLSGYMSRHRPRITSAWARRPAPGKKPEQNAPDNASAPCSGKTALLRLICYRKLMGFVRVLCYCQRVHPPSFLQV